MTVLVGAVLSLGCAGAARNADGTTNTAGPGNAIVIEGPSLNPSRGSLISILQDHVRGMNVQRTDGCPRIVMRGGLGRSQVAEALVYVDGQRMADTCVLEGLNIESIERIEAYPSGVSQRPGYTTNTGGLILVFSKNGPAQQREPL
jgi:hypothetical protein